MPLMLLKINIPYRSNVSNKRFKSGTHKLTNAKMIDRTLTEIYGEKE